MRKRGCTTTGWGIWTQGRVCGMGWIHWRRNTFQSALILIVNLLQWIILGKRLPVIDVSNYGECTVCSNIDGSEYLILCINYGGYINQYDRFVVVPSHSITQSRRIQQTSFKRFRSGLGAYIGCDIKEIEKQMMMMEKLRYKTAEGVEIVYSQSLPDWPYHCEYHFMNNRLTRYEFDYRDP